MSYENAPATTLLATNCCVCSRPLLDAESVELGIGPECRRRHGFNAKATPEARAAANKFVHAVAMAVSHGTAREVAEAVKVAVFHLKSLGFTKLADVLLERSASVRIEEAFDGLAVEAPYREDLVLEWRRIGRWDAALKRRVVPLTERRTLWAFLCRHYSGLLGVSSEKGAFVIP